LFDPALSFYDRAGLATNYGIGPAVSAVVTNTQDSGPGSLRTAMYYGFDHPGTTITFGIPTSDSGFSNNVFTIQPTDRLPSLVNGTTIDGTTEPTNSNPDGPSIVLNGSSATLPDVFANGLHFSGSNCTVRALVVNGWNGSGVAIEGTNTTGNTLAGCYIGTDPAGTSAVSNGFCGVLIDLGAHANTVGGTGLGDGNLISGNAYQGIVVRGTGVTQNAVFGNIIGLNAAGTAAVPNTYEGVAIDSGAASNTVGSVLGRNVISGNHAQGIAIRDPGSDANVVEGNYIGLNGAGTDGISNFFAGIEISGGARSTLIGGASAGNVIAGNGAQGIVIFGTNTDGTVIQANTI